MSLCPSYLYVSPAISCSFYVTVVRYVTKSIHTIQNPPESWFKQGTDQVWGRLTVHNLSATHYGPLTLCDDVTDPFVWAADALITCSHFTRKPISGLPPVTPDRWRRGASVFIVALPERPPHKDRHWLCYSDKNNASHPSRAPQAALSLRASCCKVNLTRQLHLW